MKLAYSSLVLLAASAPVAAYFQIPPACKVLNRDATCLQHQDQRFEDKTCARKANSLKALMDCVVAIPNGYRDRDGEPQDMELCDQGGSYSFADEAPSPKGFHLDCIVPRDLILAGSNLCGGNSMTGLYLTCPRNDPNFYVCLCSYTNAQENVAWLAGSKCFGNGPPPALNCPHKRDATEEAPPPDLVDALMSEVIEDQGFTFQIDGYGRPVYTNGDIGLPLPYWQTLILDGYGVKRCYIMPFSASQYCIRWRHAEKQSTLAGPNGPYPNANTGAFTLHASDTPVASTQTIAPETTTLPSTIPSLTPTSVSASERTAVTASATGPDNSLNGSAAAALGIDSKMYFLIAGACALVALY